MMINPILRNEIKTGSRSFRFYLLLMIYVALLGIPTLLIYGRICKYNALGTSSFVSLYVSLASISAIILMFLVPALSASSICGEREKQTLDILLKTMTPRSIILGKLLGVVSKVVLLIICTMPVYSFVLFLGGIKIIHIITCNLYLIMTTIFVASMSIWISTMVKTSKVANVAAYFAELGLILGLPIGILIFGSVSDVFYDTGLATDILGNILCISPAVGYVHLLGVQLRAGGGFLQLFDEVDLIMPGWLIPIGIEVILTIIFLQAAIKRLNSIKKKIKKAK